MRVWDIVWFGILEGRRNESNVFLCELKSSTHPCT